jgi:hypothetical protein
MNMRPLAVVIQVYNLYLDSVKRFVEEPCGSNCGRQGRDGGKEGEREQRNGDALVTSSASRA